MKNSKSLHVAAAAIFFVFNFSFEIRNLWSNELSVDKRTMELDDTGGALADSLTLHGGGLAEAARWMVKLRISNFK